MWSRSRRTARHGKCDMISESENFRLSGLDIEQYKVFTNYVRHCCLHCIHSTFSFIFYSIIIFMGKSINHKA